MGIQAGFIDTVKEAKKLIIFFLSDWIILVTVAASTLEG